MRTIRLDARRILLYQENAVQRAVEKTGCPVPVGLVTTSSKSKGGRADMWRLMRRVVLEGGESSEGADDTA